MGESGKNFISLKKRSQHLLTRGIFSRLGAPGAPWSHSLWCGVLPGLLPDLRDTAQVQRRRLGRGSSPPAARSKVRCSPLQSASPEVCSTGCRHSFSGDQLSHWEVWYSFIPRPGFSLLLSGHTNNCYCQPQSDFTAPQVIGAHHKPLKLHPSQLSTKWMFRFDVNKVL